MSTRSIKISNKARQKLECFKKIVDEILEDELTFEVYVDLVLSRGMASMIRDVIPADVEVLLESMEQIFDAYPDSTSDFIVGRLKKGEETTLRKRWFGEVS